MKYGDGILTSDKSRELAIRKIRDFCGGNYAVVSEGVALSSAAPSYRVTEQGNTVTLSPQPSGVPSILLTFRCVPDEPVRPSPQGPVLLGVRYELYDGTGIVVTEVMPGSAAEVAGFRPGDVVREFAGEAMTSLASLQVAISRTGPGGSFVAVVDRAGVSMSLSGVLSGVRSDVAPAPAIGCGKDTDCKGDRICESGACVDPR